MGWGIPKGNASHAGERCDRRQWRKKGAERVAAVGGQRGRIVAKAHTGYRNRTMFVRIRLRCPAAASPDKAGSRLADRGTCLPPRFICRWQRSGAQPLGSVLGLLSCRHKKVGRLRRNHFRSVIPCYQVRWCQDPSTSLHSARDDTFRVDCVKTNRPINQNLNTLCAKRAAGNDLQPVFY